MARLIIPASLRLSLYAIENTRYRKKKEEKKLARYRGRPTIAITPMTARQILKREKRKKKTK